MVRLGTKPSSDWYDSVNIEQNEVNKSMLLWNNLICDNLLVIKYLHLIQYKSFYIILDNISNSYSGCNSLTAKIKNILPPW